MKLLTSYIEYKMNRHSEIVNWENHMIGDSLLYSYRDTVYDLQSYPSSLHYHDYYELVMIEEGDIKYICNGAVYQPKYGDIILVPPGSFHKSVIDCESTRYKRHVFYFYPTAFDWIGHSELTAFLNDKKEAGVLTFDDIEVGTDLLGLLERLKKAFAPSHSLIDEALGLSYIINIFYLLNQNISLPRNEVLALPKKLLEIQEYIDRNFAEITSVSQLAEHFFYSREYISRLFKRYFDTTISDYIMKRRIERSQALILQGIPMIDIAYRVGFASLSTFIRSFRAVTDMTPSEYKKIRSGNKGT